MFNNFSAVLRCYQHYLWKQLSTRLNTPQIAVVAGCGIAVVLVLVATWSKTGIAQIRPELFRLQAENAPRPNNIANNDSSDRPNDYAGDRSRPSAKRQDAMDFSEPNLVSVSNNYDADPRDAVGRASPNVPPVDDEPVNIPSNKLKGSAAFLAKTATATAPAGAAPTAIAPNRVGASSAGGPGGSAPMFNMALPNATIARKPAKKRTKPAKPIGKPLPESLAEILPGNSLYGHWTRPLQNAAIAKVFFADDGLAYRQFQGEELEVGQWRLRGKTTLCMFWPEQLLQTSLSTKTVNDATAANGLPFGQVAIDEGQHCMRGRLVEEGYIAWQAMTSQRQVRGITVVRLGNMITDYGSVPGGYQPNDRWMLPYAEGSKILGETIARILTF